MDSFFARNRLSAYLDRSLSKREAESVAESIARDISLSADLEAMRQSLALLHDEGMVPSPKGFQARTIAAIQAQPVPGSQVAWLQRRLARIPTEIVGLAGAAIVILIGLQGSQETNNTITATVVSEPSTVPPRVSTPAPLPKNEPEPMIEPEVAAPVKATPPATPAPRTSDVLKAKPTTSASFEYDRSTPLGYRILHGGDQVLYTIAALSDTSGGRLVDVGGKIVKPFALDEFNSFARLFLITDASHANQTHLKLTKHSGMEPYVFSGPRPPISQNEVLYLIEAQL
jgi:hypothetical protein